MFGWTKKIECAPCQGLLLFARISNLPWASRPTPLKTFEQHLSAALWGLGRGLSPLLLRPRSCPHGELFRSPFPLTIFLSLLSQQSKDLSLPLPGPRSPPWQTTRFLPLSMFVIGSSESLPCSCSPVKDLSLSLSDTAPFRNHQPTRGSFLDSLLSCLYVTCSLWHPSPLFSKIWEFPQKMRGHGTVECKGCLVCEVCSSAAALNFPPFRSGSPRDPSSCRCCVPRATVLCVHLVEAGVIPGEGMYGRLRRSEKSNHRRLILFW